MGKVQIIIAYESTLSQIWEYKLFDYYSRPNSNQVTCILLRLIGFTIKYLNVYYILSFNYKYLQKFESFSGIFN